MARRLDDLIANERPEIVAVAQEKADEMLRELRLTELRHRAEHDSGDLLFRFSDRRS